MTRVGIMVLVAASTGTLGCTGSSASPDPGVDDRPSGTVLVAAAASLTDAFDDLAADFEANMPAVDVEVSVGGSSSLAVAIEEGAPADVFASANEEVMDRLVEQGAVGDADGEPVVFATNQVVIAVPEGSDVVGSVVDFERSELFLGACATQVPCGAYADELFELSGVEPSLDTRDGDVRALVTKLIEGELDAAVVYRSDVVAFADELDQIELPDGVEVVARYPVAVTDEAPNLEAAREFVRYLTGEDAHDILERAGFGVP